MHNLIHSVGYTNTRQEQTHLQPAFGTIVRTAQVKNSSSPPWWINKSDTWHVRLYGDYNVGLERWQFALS